MKEPYPNQELWAVCDPNGHIVHTTVAADDKTPIEEWLKTEAMMNWIGNLGRLSRGEGEKCADSWEGWEAQGFRVIPVTLIPRCEHEWISKYMGGNPADPSSAELVEFCKKCGEESCE